MISNAHFWNAGARSYNPICLNPLLVLDKISPLPGSSEEESGWGSVQLHYLFAHHRWYCNNPTMPSYDNGLSEHLLIFEYILIDSSLFMRIVTHVLLNMAILMLTLVRT